MSQGNKTSDFAKRAFEAFATSAMYERRRNSLRYRLKFNAVLGVLVPVAAGATALAYGAESGMAAALAVLLPLSVVQGILNAVALVWKWDEDCARAEAGLIANRRLHERFMQFSRPEPIGNPAGQLALELLDAEDERCSEEDLKAAFSEEEKRFGMRAALREYRHACFKCEKVPTSLKASDCDVCGDFNFRRFW